MKKFITIMMCMLIFTAYTPISAIADDISADNPAYANPEPLVIEDEQQTTTVDQQEQEEISPSDDSGEDQPQEEPPVDPIKAEKQQYKKCVPTIARIRALKDGEIQIAFNPLKSKNVVSYQIQRSTNKSFKKNIKKFSKNQKKSIIFFYNGKHLKKGTKYYYRIRAVVKLSDGSKYQCPWSKIKSATCKRTRT